MSKPTPTSLRRCRAGFRQRRRRADESAVQRSRAASRLAGHGARDRACGDRDDAGNGFTRRGAFSNRRRALTLIWRADGHRRGAGGARSRFRQPRRSCRFTATRGAPAIRILVRATKGGGRRRKSIPPLMLNDESGVPNKRVQEILAGKGALPLANRERLRTPSSLEQDAIAEASLICCSGADVKWIAARRLPISMISR